MFSGHFRISALKVISRNEHRILTSGCKNISNSGAHDKQDLAFQIRGVHRHQQNRAFSFLKPPSSINTLRACYHLQYAMSCSSASTTDVHGTRSPQEVTEVERKFVLANPVAFQEHIRQLGATLVKSDSFTDAYYDTDDLRFTMADFWLRQREGKWELKCPPANHKNKLTGSKNTRYLEQECPQTIMRSLSHLLGQGTDPGVEDIAATAQTLEEMLEAHGCQVFARYTTQRQTYTLDDTTIDLDATDFGFSVGEIETVVRDQADMDEAAARLDQLADKLGIQSTEAAQSKMSAYLQKFKPDIYKVHLTIGLA